MLNVHVLNSSVVAAADPLFTVSPQANALNDRREAGRQSASPGTDLLVEMSRQMGEGLNVSHGMVRAKSD